MLNILDSMYQDQDAGLSGPVIVYNRGGMESTMASYREFIVGYFDNQESNSFLASHNVMKYLPAMASAAVDMSNSTYPKVTQGLGNSSFWYPQSVNTPLTPGLTSAILPNFFPINGYIFSNAPAFEMCVNDNAMWYVWDMGFDTHVFHLHGHNVVQNGVAKASVAINPGEMTNLQMTVANPGLWQLLCHFNTHDSKGMEANYMVYPSGSGCPLPALKQIRMA